MLIYVLYLYKRSRWENKNHNCTSYKQNYHSKIQTYLIFQINISISMKMWRAFLHVLIINPTYKTNLYHLHFLQIVVLTSTNKIFCIVFAFIRNEKTDNFKWVLHFLRQTLDGYMLPRVIVTDRYLTLMEACRYVFPEASRYENIIKNCMPSFAP